MRKLTISLMLSGFVVASLLSVSQEAHAKKSPILASSLNFFLPGTGYLYNGDKPLYVTLPMIAGFAGLTYVENFHEFEGGKTLKEVDLTAFSVLFAAVLVANTGFAIDAYREAESINKREANSSLLSNLQLGVTPVMARNGDRDLTLSLSGSF